MIKVSKSKNWCNSCHAKKNTTEIKIGGDEYTNCSMVISLCEDCCKKLKEAL